MNRNTREFIRQVETAVNSHRAWRERTGFGLPSPRESIMYAVTEIGEAYDALLRIERADDVRRRPDVDVCFECEVADTAAMLVSALVAAGISEINIAHTMEEILSDQMNRVGDGRAIELSLLYVADCMVRSRGDTLACQWLTGWAFATLVALIHLEDAAGLLLPDMMAMFESKIELRLEQR